MTHFDYNPKKITPEEMENNMANLFNNSSFQYGDIVRLKGDVVGPQMIVTEISVNTQPIMYQTMERKYIIATCQWFNKSRQEFVKTGFNVLCLSKIEE